MSDKINLKPIEIGRAKLRIKNRAGSPLVMHAWDEKAKRQMRDKHAGKKTKNREVRDPKAEFEAATYRTGAGKYGLPVDALKSSLVSAAHKDLGVEKTLIRKALFIVSPDDSRNLEMKAKAPVMREDVVRVGAGSTDLRYRPEFTDWTVDVEFEFDTTLLRLDDLVGLINRAGFGVGLGERRPEKGGEWGRYELDTSVEIKEARPAK